MQISETEQFIQTHRKDTDLGKLFREETSDKPWILPISESNQLCAYSEEIHVVISNLLYITKVGITQNGLNRLKRLAAFKNPDFYKAQAMHMSTYGKPRVISLASEDENYIMLPRGCKEALMQLMMENDSKVHFTDETVSGRTINVSFCGTLRPEQQDAVQALTTYDTGVLAATTAFGKTVTAAGIITKRKVNTLILVHTQALLEQWKKSLTEFLDIHEVLPEEPVKRGRKRKRSLIGQLGSSKNTLNQIIDIAVMQSLYHDGEVKPIVNQYGMVLVDECHHISAFSFEAILRETHAKYVYGLTATPKRSDGHQPIIFMQCDPIRYQADAKEYAQKHNFSHILIPRFTKYRAVTDEKMTITQHYQAIYEINTRNQMISEDVKKAVSDGRTPIVISERTFHITKLYELLQNYADHVIILNGKGTAKEKRERLAIIQTLPENESVILLATGKYIGEGSDFPRLDTLFLTMPISWSGTLAQYAGRLHREHDGKTSAVIYDYADLHVPMLENMYKKRLRGYAQLGYTLADQQQNEIDFQSIYSNEKYIKDLLLDIASAKRSLVICGGYYSTGYVNQISKIAETLYANNVSIKVIIKKSSTSYHEKLVQLFSFHGFQCTLKNHINHSFAIIDETTV